MAKRPRRSQRRYPQEQLPWVEFTELTGPWKTRAERARALLALRCVYGLDPELQRALEAELAVAAANGLDETEICTILCTAIKGWHNEKARSIIYRQYQELEAGVRRVYRELAGDPPPWKPVAPPRRATYDHRAGLNLEIISPKFAELLKAKPQAATPPAAPRPERRFSDMGLLEELRMIAGDEEATDLIDRLLTWMEHADWGDLRKKSRRATPGNPLNGVFAKARQSLTAAGVDDYDKQTWWLTAVGLLEEPPPRT